MLKAFHTPSRHAYLLIAALAISGCRLQPTLQKDSLQGTKPNILFVISDVKSYPYASAYGSKVIHPPALDRIPRAAILFTSAFAASPARTPSRAALLNGLHRWHLRTPAKPTT